MGKKVNEEEPEKSTNHSDPGKIIKNKMGSFENGDGKQLKSQEEPNIEAVRAKLTQELANLRNGNKNLKDNIKELQFGNDRQANTQAQFDDQMG